MLLTLHHTECMFLSPSTTDQPSLFAKLPPMETTPNTLTSVFDTEDQTAAFAAAIARALTEHAQCVRANGFNLRLTGDLGAGKTTTTRALLRALGVTGRVKSPTFELVAEYDVLGDIAFYHFDFYRFESPVEFLDAGFRDMFGSARITVCEWSEKAGEFLPDADLEVTLTVSGDGRRMTAQAKSETGIAVLKTVAEVFHG